MSKSRNQAVTREAKRLMPRCKRCCGSYDLHAHHIIPLCRGGEDDVKNIDVLCGPCHVEWHRLLEGAIPYDRFFETTPAHVVAKAAIAEELRDMPLSAIHEIWMALRVGAAGVFVAEGIEEAYQSGAIK